jgi:hypothetical protein
LLALLPSLMAAPMFDVLALIGLHQDALGLAIVGPRGHAAIIKDARKTDGQDRDLVHGDGGTIDLPVKPGGMSKDD